MTWYWRIAGIIGGPILIAIVILAWKMIVAGISPDKRNEVKDNLMRLFFGAAAIGKDGRKHPTSAGLLMFGNEYEIVREFPSYFLDYQERYDETTRWTDRIISSSGDWSGNIYDFYFRVYNKLVQDIKVPFKLEGVTRIEDLSLIHISEPTRH